jgi:hypothetical protein
MNERDTIASVYPYGNIKYYHFALAWFGYIDTWHVSNRITYSSVKEASVGIMSRMDYRKLNAAYIRQTSDINAIAICTHFIGL